MCRQVGFAFPLQGKSNHGSVTRAALDSAIRRRVGLKSKAVYTARTFGELETNLFPDTAGDSQRPISSPTAEGVELTPLPPHPPEGAAPVACGIDIELVESFPAAADYWEDEFYTTHFTPREIAYCIQQVLPPLHFAARWCAKEALKKCDSRLLSEEMRNLELISERVSRPYLSHYVDGHPRRLPHAVSLSHTVNAAVAVVVNLNGAPPPEPPDSTGSPPLAPAGAGPPPELESPHVAPKLWHAFQAMISIAALGLALFALIRTLRP